MRLKKVSKWLLLGGGVAALVLGQRRSRARGGRRDNRARDLSEDEPGPDPRDPVQGFQEALDLGVDLLSVDAFSVADAEAAQDLAMLETDLDERALELDTPSQTELDAIDAATPHDTGELYGVHTQRAVDRLIPEDRVAMDEGETWMEALQASAVEYGAEPEQDIDVVDEVDEPPHPTDTRDIPVADRGSAGPGGV